MNAKRLVAVLISLSCAGLAPADETPAIGRGFALDKLYQFGDVDSVDLQTGALSVAIPIGTAYPLSEHFSYSLTLTHSSRVWDYEPATEGYWAYPNRRSNSGIGWSLNLGLLLEPTDPANPLDNQWTYVSPDGGAHGFSGLLHSGESDGDTTNSVDYTHDSTYLRLKHMGNLQEIEFPDGTIKQFEQVGSTIQYRLKEIRDHFVSGGSPQNWVHITYPDSLTWTITDSKGRTHTVKFVSLQYDTTAVPMVDYVDLSAFDGTPARWNFTYLGGGSSAIYRDCHQNNGTTLSAPVLASVTRPDGTTWSFEAYNLDPGPGRFECRQSELSSLIFPTGGEMQYTYSTFQLPANDPCPDPLGTGAMVVLVLSMRTLHDPVVRNPSTPDSIWEYEYSVNSPVMQDICGTPATKPVPPEELTVTVWTPANDKTDYFFSVWPAFGPSLSGFLSSEYGLPFTRLAPQAGTRFLSSRTFDCNASGTGCVAKRSEYVLYEQDTTGDKANRRLLGRRTVYDDDGGKWADVAYSNFDGVGHYRQVTTDGNFDTGNVQTEFTNFNPSRGTYPGSYNVLLVNYPWILGAYDRIDVTGGSPSDTARRVFDFDIQIPPLVSTGFLKSVRTYKIGTTPGSNDLFTLFCKDAMGDATSEISYGGDGSRFQLPAPLPNCDSGPPASGWQYRLDHTYSSGVRATSQYSGTSHFILDLTINAATGLPSASRDSAEVETTFTYDDLGRLTRSIPVAFSTLQRDDQTEYTFWAPGIVGGILRPASVEVKRCAPAQANCATNDTDEYLEVTGFGQPWHEVRRMPDNLAVRVTRYDPMGSKARISSWVYDSDAQFVDENALPATAFSGYDPFGRPAIITQPDSTVTTHEYLGVRWVKTDQNLALAIGGADQCVRRWDRNDRQGRLDRVEEAYTNCTTGGPTMVTEYSYDEAGRLANVCQNKTGSTCGQQRLFAYDNRGFLTSEQHPEKGATGQGTVSYSCYDARGHARYRDDGIFPGRRLAYTFDFSERLMKVRVPLDTETCDQSMESGTTWKQFTFATTNSGSNARKGKLETAFGRNEVGAPAFLPGSIANVTETYTYQERGGRVSKRTTALSGTGVASETWEVAQTFDPLGLTATQNYPLCTSGAGCAGAPGIRSVAMTYTDGMLETITGGDSTPWMTDLTYHASGMAAAVTHGNGLMETTAQASNGMGRPQSITISAPGEPTPFSTGTYSYDGGGNIKAMGPDLFRYDKFQRLVEAQMGSLAPSQTQTTTFDAYGNITAMNTSGTGENFPTSATTNRLTSALYDASGNTTSWNGNLYLWDRFNRMTHWANGSEGWSYVYTADDERLWTIQDALTPAHATWTIRGLGNEVLTRDERLPSPGLLVEAPGDCAASPPLAGIFCDGFESGNTNVWSTTSQGSMRKTVDYVYRQGQLLAARTINEDDRHFGLDHLGTVRIASNLKGDFIAFHTYFPFGREATTTTQDTEVMKFTGHERDLQSTLSATADDMDYMHARYHSPLTGRMLSVDPAGGNPKRPQSWNRYAYVMGNPLRYVDPDGMRADEAWKIVWSRLKHIIDKHILKVETAGTKFIANNPRAVQKDIAKTINRADRIDTQLSSGNLVFQKAFNSDKGVNGERVITVYAKQLSEDTLRVETAHPAFEFKDILSFLPGALGTWFGVQEMTEAGAHVAGDAMERAAVESGANQRQTEQEELANSIDQ